MGVKKIKASNKHSDPGENHIAVPNKTARKQSKKERGPCEYAWF